MKVMNLSIRQPLLYLILPGLSCLCNVVFLTEPQKERKMGEGGKGGRLRRGKRIVCFFGRGAGEMYQCIRDGRRG